MNEFLQWLETTEEEARMTRTTTRQTHELRLFDLNARAATLFHPRCA